MSWEQIGPLRYLTTQDNMAEEGMAPKKRLHISHPSSVMTKENAAESSKSTDYVSFDGDRRLNARRISDFGDEIPPAIM